jgi:hypothetical protein
VRKNSVSIFPFGEIVLKNTFSLSHPFRARRDANVKRETRDISSYLYEIFSNQNQN